jgi:hypothetical protein
MASTGDQISKRLENLIKKDLSKMSTNDIVSAITGGEGINGEYVDLQSDKGYKEVSEQVEKDANSVIESLKPKGPPIPLKKIEELSCNYEGDELYARIVLESVRRKNKKVYRKLIRSGILENKTLTAKDLGVKDNPLFDKNSKISSGPIEEYLVENSPKLIEDINERIFDNLDPLLLGKPSNSGSKKKRELNVLGFKMPLEFIMSGTSIVHVKIGGEKKTNKEALDTINSMLDKQYASTKPCDGDKPSSERIDEYDANFYPDGDDPIDDCNTGFPEDPITGDPIITEESINDIGDDFCDPPPSDYSNLNPNEEEPPPSNVDIGAIQDCLDSAFEKADKIDKNTNLLGRWQMIERYLEEIYYHYRVIWEYQKSLVDNWRSRITPSGGDPTDFELAFEILSLQNQEKNIEADIQNKNRELEDDRTIFLEKNPDVTDLIFALNGFDIETYIELSDDQLKDEFQQRIDSGDSLVSFDDESQSYNIDEGIAVLRENYQYLISLLVRENLIESLELDLSEVITEKESSLATLSERRETVVNIEDIEKTFLPTNTTSSDPYAQYSTQLIKNDRVFKRVVGTALYTYDGYGFKFLEDLEKFSIRFKGTRFNYQRSELNFKLTLMSDLGNPLPYKEVKKPGKISLETISDGVLKTVSEPDKDKIKIGNEYAGNGGLLSEFEPVYLESYQFLDIANKKEGESDIAEFYDYVEKVINTNQSKEQIIQSIIDDRGTLYGRLIEPSGSNWLFFNAEERGDNDARNPADLKPAGSNTNGEPSPKFEDFYSNFKTKWDAKYTQVRSQYIDPELNNLINEAKKAGEGLGKTLSTADVVGVRLYENYFSVKEKYDRLEELILYVATTRGEIEESLTPEKIEEEFSSIKCSSAKPPDDPENCPPECCGEPGSDFNTENYLMSSPPSSDCPTIYQKCWWKQFAKDVTKVGLLPYPNGLPPIEDSSFFLGGGPSVRLGFKYWPVGYLPPAFIPIPSPNPIDGQPFIRIPLPMIWTIIPPIVIPLPFNLGILVIFIPFIGGFMPTPLIYLKEFILGNSLFLTGIRGPRFIPRKSDPELKDPLEKIKQMLSFGVPDKLIPFPGFGKDNIDAPERILGDLQSNMTKIFDSVPPPGNIEALRELQNLEVNLKDEIAEENKEYLKKEALLDIEKPNEEEQRRKLEALISERKRVLSEAIEEYIDKGIPDPKTIYFPQDKDKLKIDIPGIVKSFRILKDMKSSFVPIKCPGSIDYKDEIREVLKLLKIPTPPKYILDNIDVSNANKIYLRQEKDPRTMNEEEFKDLVKEIRSVSLVVTHILMRGNRFSVIKKIRDGAFSITENCDFQGTIAFPPIELTNSAPLPLKFIRRIDPRLNEIYLRIMAGMSSIEYTPEDFVPYIRYFGETPELVIRVKDLKKIISKKIGLTRRGPFEPERPLDKEEPLISNYPHPEGPLCCLESLNQGFGTAISAIELPTIFPLKQDQISQTQGLGGIVQITIPGSVIKKFIKESVGVYLNNGGLDVLIPEINNVDSPKFKNLDPSDIQKISRNIVREILDPNSGNIPPFMEAARVPIIPKARPTDFVEQTLIGMGAPPPARIVFSKYWEYFKGVPKTPLGEKIVLPSVEISSSILSKIPWPVTVLLGRNVVNLINPLVFSDDLPAWRRMSLKNTYYVVYIDEFLRSAADVSGLYKFFFGSANPVYPIPELPSELKKAFNVKKY